MPKWPRHPTIFEINTWVWLSELSQRYKVARNLANVPARQWDAVAEFGFDAVWLMGVWERNQGLPHLFHQPPPNVLDGIGAGLDYKLFNIADAAGVLQRQKKHRNY